MATNFKVTGADEVIRQLEAVKARVGGKAIKNILVPGAKIIQKSAKQKSPVKKGGYTNRSRKPGTLKKSIKLKSRSFDDTGRAVAYVTVQDPVGHLVEYGHKVVPPKAKGKAGSGNAGNYYKRKEGTGKKIVAPKPYMRPAIDETEAEVFEKLADGTKNLLKEFGLR